MAPIPTKRKYNNDPPFPVAVSTDNVYDDYGKSLNELMQDQSRTDSQQTENIAINRQHATQYESNTEKNRLVYRDVFPGRKYKLTLSDTTWMGSGNTVTIGYTVGDTFTQLLQTDTAPSDNVFSVEMPVVSVIDTMEVRFVGASDTIRGYLEDNTTSSSISASIASILDRIADLISGSESQQQAINQLQIDVGQIKQDITTIQGNITTIQDDISSLDNRVTALEQAQPQS